MSTQHMPSTGPGLRGGERAQGGEAAVCLHLEHNLLLGPDMAG